MRRLVPDWLLHHAAARPDRRAVTAAMASWTFAQLATISGGLALALADQGIGVGSRLACLLEDDAPAVALIHAARRLGAVLVPLNRRAAVSELRHQLDTVQVDLLIHDATHRDVARALIEAAGMLSDAERRPGLASIAALLELERTPFGSLTALRDQVDLLTPATILFTSGTTGTPKAAVLSHGNHLASADAWADRLRPQPPDRWLACLPLFHVAGSAMVMRTSHWGCEVEIQPRFEASDVADAIEAGASHLSLVSTMLDDLIDIVAARSVPATLRAILLGGGPIAPSLLERAVVAELPVVTTYGMTETASGVAAGGPAASAFQPLRGVELRISPAGGELQVRGEMVFLGYLGPDGEIDDPAEDGWFTTGDLGELDALGRLRVLDRRDDLLISGGENVYPSEIEAVLTGHPEIDDAIVVSEAHQRWGAVPVAVIVLKPGSTVSDATLAAHCRSRLAGYKVPVAFHRRASLPRSGAGKVLRNEVRASLVEESV